MPHSKHAFLGQNPFAQDRSTVHAPEGAAVVPLRPLAARRIPDCAEVLRLCQLERTSPELMRKAFG